MYKILKTLPGTYNGVVTMGGNKIVVPQKTNKSHYMVQKPIPKRIKNQPFDKIFVTLMLMSSLFIIDNI